MLVNGHTNAGDVELAIAAEGAGLANEVGTALAQDVVETVAPTEIASLGFFSCVLIALIRLEVLPGHLALWCGFVHVVLEALVQRQGVSVGQLQFTRQLRC